MRLKKLIKKINKENTPPGGWRPEAQIEILRLEKRNADYQEIIAELRVQVTNITNTAEELRKQLAEYQDKAELIEVE